VSPRSGILGFGAGFAEIFWMKRPVFGDGAQQRSLRVRKVQGKTHVKRGLREVTEWHTIYKAWYTGSQETIEQALGYPVEAAGGTPPLILWQLSSTCAGFLHVSSAWLCHWLCHWTEFGLHSAILALLLVEDQLGHVLSTNWGMLLWMFSSPVPWLFYMGLIPIQGYAFTTDCYFIYACLENSLHSSKTQSSPNGSSNMLLRTDYANQGPIFLGNWELQHS
jgi:hypothetical protein